MRRLGDNKLDRTISVFISQIFTTTAATRLHTSRLTFNISSGGGGTGRAIFRIYFIKQKRNPARTFALLFMFN